MKRYVAAALIWFLTASLAWANATSGNVFKALQADTAVQSDCPALVGVAIPDPDNNATWIAQFASGTSGACNTAVAAVFTNYHEPHFPTTLQIASTGTSALNGTYATDTATVQQINNIQIYLLIYGDFPNAASTIAWPDVTSVTHTFSKTNWSNFAKAVTDFLATEATGTTVSQPVTIP